MYIIYIYILDCNFNHPFIQWRIVLHFWEQSNLNWSILLILIGKFWINDWVTLTSLLYFECCFYSLNFRLVIFSKPHEEELALPYSLHWEIYQRKSFCCKIKKKMNEGRCLTLVSQVLECIFLKVEDLLFVLKMISI